MTNKKFDNGVHQISNADYHASEGISRSALMKFKKCPALYWHEYLNPDYVKPESTQNMFLGSLVHTLVLEPEKFNDEYIVEPIYDPLPKVGLLKDLGREEYDRQKAQREAVSVANDMLKDKFNEQAEGKIIVSRETYDKACSMQDAVLKNNECMDLIDGADIEKSIFFTHQPTGLQCKVRPDAWMGSVVTDLKTCYDASYRTFQSEAMRYGYFLQAGMIYRALQSINQSLDEFVFICVEKNEPYLIATYVLDHDAIDYGVELFDKLMFDLKDCYDNDRWPAYDLQTLCVPGWAKYDY